MPSKEVDAKNTVRLELAYYATVNLEVEGEGDEIREKWQSTLIALDELRNHFSLRQHKKNAYCQHDTYSMFSPAGTTMSYKQCSICGYRW